MLGRAARLGGANRARAAQSSARPNRAEPERQDHATEQAEPSMQATEPSPSGPSARFARFDSRPADGQEQIGVDGRWGHAAFRAHPRLPWRTLFLALVPEAHQ